MDELTNYYARRIHGWRQVVRFERIYSRNGREALHGRCQAQSRRCRGPCGEGLPSMAAPRIGSRRILLLQPDRNEPPRGHAVDGHARQQTCPGFRHPVIKQAPADPMLIRNGCYRHTWLQGLFEELRFLGRAPLAPPFHADNCRTLALQSVPMDVHKDTKTLY